MFKSKILCIQDHLLQWFTYSFATLTSEVPLLIDSSILRTQPMPHRHRGLKVFVAPASHVTQQAITYRPSKQKLDMLMIKRHVQSPRLEPEKSIEQNSLPKLYIDLVSINHALLNGRSLVSDHCLKNL